MYSIAADRQGKLWYLSHVQLQIRDGDGPDRFVRSSNAKVAATTCNERDLSKAETVKHLSVASIVLSLQRFALLRTEREGGLPLEPYSDQDDDPETKTPGYVSSALYLCDKGFGGPEEGGWWYDTYFLVDLDEAREILPAHWQPQFSTQAFDAERGIEMPTKEFLAHVEEANPILDHTVNMDRYDISSVRSYGQYRVCWFDGMPYSRPTKKPRYE